MLSWRFEMELQPWVYDHIMGAPQNYHIGHMSPRVTLMWGWK